MARSSKQILLLTPSCRVCFLFPFSCMLWVLCFPLPLGVPGPCALAPLAVARDGSGKTQTSGEKNKAKQKKRCSYSISNPLSPEWESYEKPGSHRTPSQEAWTSDPRGCVSHHHHQDHDGFGGAQLWFCWPLDLQGCSASTSRQLDQHPGMLLLKPPMTKAGVAAGGGSPTYLRSLQ